MTLPADEAPHETPIEWWYFNGFIWDDIGNEYSFHYVTFQSPTLPVGAPHLLHATLADHQTELHLAGERGALATLDPDAPSVDVDAEGWVMRGDGEGYQLQFDLEGRSVALDAASTREPTTRLDGPGQSWRSRQHLLLLSNPHGIHRPTSGYGWHA